MVVVMSKRDSPRSLEVEYKLATNGTPIVPPVRKSCEELTDGDIGAIAARAPYFTASWGADYSDVESRTDARKTPALLIVHYKRRGD